MNTNLALPLVNDPDEVAQLGRERAAEHWAVHDRLAPDLQAGVTELSEFIESVLFAVMASIDCADCGRCCQHMGPPVREEEAERLASALQLGKDEFRARYLQPMWPGASAELQVWLLPTPCPLHDGRLCTVYEARPQVCRDFPQASGDSAAERLRILTETARLCPIAFNTLERLAITFDTT